MLCIFFSMKYPCNFMRMLTDDTLYLLAFSVFFCFEIIINFCSHSCVFHEFNWSTGYIHFAMKQNMAAVLLLQKMFLLACETLFSSFFQQFAS